MIIGKQKVIQFLYYSKIYLDWLKMSKFPQKISAFFTDAPLTGLFSVSVAAQRYFQSFLYDGKMNSTDMTIDGKKIHGIWNLKYERKFSQSVAFWSFLQSIGQDYCLDLSGPLCARFQKDSNRQICLFRNSKII